MDPLRLVWHYLWQMVCGSAYFAGVALLAFVLHFFVSFLEAWDLPWFMIAPIQIVEIVLLYADLGLFVFFIIIEAHKMAQEIWKARKS